MCGIAGVVYSDPLRSVDQMELTRMTEVIEHRGPDDEGYYINQNVGLGFRRLSIIDISSGHQPLANEDNSIWIVFNGEIYNFKELRNDLKKRGHVFKTKTDTEVIVHLYEDHGVDCVDFLRGMFAFAIWDNRQKKLFCARDRFGIKPFYYSIDNEKFVFGSELKVLTRAGVSGEINLNALDSYLAYGYITQDLSIYQGIKKLKAGHTLELDLQGFSIKKRKYWKVIFQPDYSKSEDEWCYEIRNSLIESVKMRLISDVPLGAFLSGGVDSSSIVALMSQISNQQVKTFSIGFKEAQFNELAYAREIANRYETDHHEYILEPESVSLLPKLVTAYDEPFGDSSAIPTYYLSKFTRQYVTVALSGDGGDELFAGYNNYTKMDKIHRYNTPWPGFNKYIWGSLYRIIPLKVKGKGITYFLSHDKEKVGAYFAYTTLPERAKLYKRSVWDLVKTDYAELYKEQVIAECNSPDFISRMQHMDISTWLVDDILTKVDRASMHNSLEARVPILDHKFAELTFKIPPSLKLKGSDKKYIFKKAMENDLPKSILKHKKQGFAIPLSSWFKDDLKEYIQDRLNSKNSFVSEYLDTAFISKLIEDHNHGMRSLHRKIWGILFLDVWLEQQKKLTKP